MAIDVRHVVELGVAGVLEEDLADAIEADRRPRMSASLEHPPVYGEDQRRTLGRPTDDHKLAGLDVDRLLHNFRLNAGLPSSAQPLGGWEEPKCELRGHFVGHYLTACALMYASTGDKKLKEKGDQVVAGLAECQAKLGSEAWSLGALGRGPNYLGKIIMGGAKVGLWLVVALAIISAVEYFIRFGPQVISQKAE